MKIQRWKFEPLITGVRNDRYANRVRSNLLVICFVETDHSDLKRTRVFQFGRGDSFQSTRMTFYSKEVAEEAAKRC